MHSSKANSSRNPGRHVTRVNNAHDRLCEKAKTDGVALDFGSLRSEAHLRDTHGPVGDRPGDARQNPWSQFDPDRGTLRPRVPCFGTKQVRWRWPKLGKSRGPIESNPRLILMSPTSQIGGGPKLGGRRGPVEANIFCRTFCRTPTPNLPDFCPVEADPERTVGSEWSAVKSSNCKRRYGGAGENRTRE
jgi:hypothetical protein